VTHRMSLTCVSLNGTDEDVGHSADTGGVGGKPIANGELCHQANMSACGVHGHCPGAIGSVVAQALTGHRFPVPR